MKAKGNGGRKVAVVVCGPSAAGKSEVADGIAAALSESLGAWVPTLAVDSMQVYSEVPETTNQRRGRRSEMVGIVSVEEEWTVARHKERSEALISGLPDGSPFVLDAGTGMYLNAILLGIPLAPKVSAVRRAEAVGASDGSPNPRRAARAEELRMAGAPERGSIWSGVPVYDATVIYLRPPRDLLDLRIARRSETIARDGIPEGENLLRLNPNESVRQAVGPREMMMLASQELSPSEVRDRIAARTRRLARRQMRWFDKLLRTLPDDTNKTVLETADATADDARIKHIMHDIIEAWS